MLDTHHIIVHAQLWLLVFALFTTLNKLITLVLKLNKKKIKKYKIKKYRQDISAKYRDIRFDTNIDNSTSNKWHIIAHVKLGQSL